MSAEGRSADPATSHDTPTETTRTEAERSAERQGPDGITIVTWTVLVVFVFTLVGFLLLATGRLNQFAWWTNGAAEVDAGLLLQDGTADLQTDIPALDAEVAPLGSGGTNQYTVDPLFQGFYDRYGGVTGLGLPISPLLVVNGREVQWFERARLEYWPEFSGTDNVVQAGRLGVELTSGRSFPQQAFFVSRPDLRFFPETGHAVGGAFLRYWNERGGLWRFGFPISDELDEMLDDGRIYRVQYFERARLEYHPEARGTPYEVQIGLLGRALYLNEGWPAAIPVAPQPTMVPLP